MIIHNLIIGWRNILKYKTQNIISVLCLSFGVLCFAVTLYFADVMWQNLGKKVMTSNYVTLASLESHPIKGDEYHYNFKPIYREEITKIKQLPMVKHVGYSLYENSYSGKDSLYDKKNKHGFFFGFRINFVSPEWFLQKDFYSATTGKKIEVLKPGAAVLNRKYLKSIIGESRYTGEYVFNHHLGWEYTVDDIVYSPTLDEGADVYIVIDKSNYDYYIPFELDITLKNGYTFDDLKKELTKVLPDHRWTKLGGDSKGMAFLVFFLLISIGISVLVIGLSGYLKMQLQLFLLRRREMAICRCNGARPIQLFYMLLAEIFIVFTFVAAISLAISYAFEAYSMPLIHDTGMLDRLDFEPSIIYRTEIKIVLFTFLASVAIAWFVVRRSLKTPLVNTVGRSFTQRTRWNGTMQVVQYSTAIIFFFVCTMILGALEYLKNGRFDVPGGPGYYKDILVFDYLPSDKVKALPSIESHACVIDLRCEIRTEIDTTSTAIPRDQRLLKDDIQVNEYRFTATNSEAFRLFKMDIYKDTTEAYKTIKCPIPVFVKPEHLKETMSILGLSYQVSPQEYVLPDHKRYVVLGFTDNLPNSNMGYMPKKFIVIDNNEGFIDEEIDSVSVPDRYPFTAVKPRNNDRDAAITAMDELQHKMYPSLGADIHYGATIAYDAWFKQLKILNYIMELTSVLTLVSLICIVMTVFSSISLETRGRQKDVAIRKVNGAKIRDIVMLFGRYYIVTISISSLIALLIVVVLIICISIIGRDWPDAELTLYLCLFFLSSIAVITGVTVATVWQKIYRISHTNPSEIISKD